MHKELHHAVIYARFSSHLQREESIDAQVRIVREFAIRQHMVIVGVYIDRAKSATTDQRPEFLRMIEDARQGMFDTILVHKYDRFARNRKDSVVYRELLHNCGVHVSSVTEYFLPDLPETALFESIIDGISEFYSRNLSREVQKGLMENAIKGKHTGGRPPFGYDIDRNTLSYLVNETEASAVRLIFERHNQGFSYSDIADELNQMGLQTRNKTSFGKNSLHDILCNEKYCGTYIYNKSASKDSSGHRNGHAHKAAEEIVRIENGMPAIIEKTVFQDAQHRIRIRTSQRPTTTVREFYLLSGKVECGECGSTFAGNRKTADHGSRIYISYRCSKSNGKSNCHNGEIKRDDLEAFVLHELFRLVSSKTKVITLLQAYKKQLRSDHEKSYYLLKYTEAAIIQTRQQIDNIVGVLSRQPSDALILELNRLEEAQARYQYQLAKLEQIIQLHRVSKDELSNLFIWAKNILTENDVSHYPELVNRCVKKVVIRQDQVIVHWDMGFCIDVNFHEKNPFICVIERKKIKEYGRRLKNKN